MQTKNYIPYSFIYFFLFYYLQLIYIPLTTHGYFYAVSTANNTAEDNVSKVYQIGKLLQVFPLPVRVCSIYPKKINGNILYFLLFQILFPHKFNKVTYLDVYSCLTFS